MTADAVRSEVDPSARLLALTPATDETSACTALQSRGSPAETNALTVTYADADAAWRSHVETPPANAAVVVVGRDDPDTEPGVARNETRVESVADGGDLSALGVTVTRILDEWSDHPYRTTLDFRSLTALLQYVDAEAAFRFLHTLTARMDRSDAGGYFYLTPDAVDDRTSHLLRHPFDAVVERTDDGWILHREDGGSPRDDS